MHVRRNIKELRKRVEMKSKLLKILRRDAEKLLSFEIDYEKDYGFVIRIKNKGQKYLTIYGFHNVSYFIEMVRIAHRDYILEKLEKLK